MSNRITADKMLLLKNRFSSESILEDSLAPDFYGLPYKSAFLFAQNCASLTG